MEQVYGTLNWIKITDDDNVPPIDNWDVDDLCYALQDAIFQIHGCGKYTVVYRAEVLLRREHPGATDQANLIVDVDCPRDGDNLRNASHVAKLDQLPIQSFSIYKLHEVRRVVNSY
jgi:hypothetical protein